MFPGCNFVSRKKSNVDRHERGHKQRVKAERKKERKKRMSSEELAHQIGAEVEIPYEELMSFEGCSSDVVPICHVVT